MKKNNSALQVIFSDFDGTLTCGNDLTPKFFELLGLLEKHKTPLVIVTGRSISWGHFLLTHFKSLDYVITEGGGSIVRRGVGAELINEYLVSDEMLFELSEFSRNLLTRFEEISLSADSVGRIADRAIELEEFSEIPEQKIIVEEFMKAQGINFSTSSVHLNFWKGDISKYTAVTYFLETYMSEVSLEQSIFFGDSLNDQSMFKEIKNSVGVSNIKSCIDQLDHIPSVVLEGSENAGINGVYRYLLQYLK